jgi:hypothetical protein
MWYLAGAMLPAALHSPAHYSSDQISQGAELPELNAHLRRVELQFGCGGFMDQKTGGSQGRAPQPNEKLVKVFDAEQESEAMVVSGLLQSQGIDNDITALDAPQDILPGVGGTVILVREEDAARARQLISESRRSPKEIAIDEIADANAEISGDSALER